MTFTTRERRDLILALSIAIDSEYALISANTPDAEWSPPSKEQRATIRESQRLIGRLESLRTKLFGRRVPPVPRTT